MKKAVLTVMIAAALLSSCKGQLPDKLQAMIDSGTQEYSRKASEDIKDAFISQMEEFLKSDDLGESLNLSSEEKDNIERSVQNYVDQYELSEEELNKVQDSIKELLQNVQGLDADTIEDKLGEILKK